MRCATVALGALPLGLPALREGAHEGGERLGLLDRDARVQRGAQPRTVAEGRQRAEAHLAREKGEGRGSDAGGWEGGGRLTAEVGGEGGRTMFCS